MGIKPAYSSDFELPAEGTFLFKIASADFKNSEEKGFSFLTRDVIEDSIEHDDIFNGQGILDNFPLSTNFGKARLLGLGVKALNMDADKEYPDDYFNDEKVQNKIAKALVGKTFGGMVRHSKDGKFANIKEYFTVTEYDEKAGGKEKKKEKGGKGKTGSKSAEEEEEWN